MKQEFKILLVEDQESFREGVIQLLGVYNEVVGAKCLAEARELLQKETFEVVILDRNLPDGDGLYFIQEVKTENPSSVVIILTSNSDYGSIKKSVNLGADDYVVKSENIIPDLLVRIPIAVARAAGTRRLDQLSGQVKQAFKYELIGQSKAATELRLAILNHRGTQSTVLLTGESGVGKEVVARRLHAVEDSKSRPFYALNCASLPDQLIESELFGHKKGSFTGAISDKAGKFELANGGDLFLDEVGELSPVAQSKLLRVLQDGVFYRVGGTRPIQVECRIIAATNQNLEDLVEKKKFRLDLFYRLNVARFHIPPLRERVEDIPALAQFFLMQNEWSSLSFTDKAELKLKSHDWPGNIRELRNVVERAILTAKRKCILSITDEDLTLDTRLNPSESSPFEVLKNSLPSERSDLSEQSYREYMEQAERTYLSRALSIYGGNVADAAVSIGMSRSNLFRRVSQLGLGKKRQDSAEEGTHFLRTSLGESELKRQTMRGPR